MGDNSMSMSMDESTLDFDNSIAIPKSPSYREPEQKSSSQTAIFNKNGLLDSTTPSESEKIRNGKFSTKASIMLKDECTTWSVLKTKRSLHKAVFELSHRGLKLASKWASELLVGLSASDTDPTEEKSLEDEDRDFLTEMFTSVTSVELYAKSLFELGEYHHAAFILSSSPVSQNTENFGAATLLIQSSVKTRIATAAIGANSGSETSSCGDITIPPPRDNLSSFGIYLRAYALYLAGEKRKEEEHLELRDSLERTALRNPYLTQLIVELHSYYVSGCLDAFGLYVYGLVLKEVQKNPAGIGISRNKVDMLQTETTGSSRVGSFVDSGYGKQSASMPVSFKVLVASILFYPYNWSAWLDLSELCLNDSAIQDEVEQLLSPITNHWMYHFFCIHLFLENQANENALEIIERLIHGMSDDPNDDGFFARSPYLQSQMAVAHYNMRDFDTAQSHFVAISQRDPLQLDRMDVYSNILYVKENRVALSQLAHRAVRIDKYRPETCCIIGNYYSIKSQHEKAVQYFQRALKLDRTYLSAWTLMGHEYIEMKNSAAAIEAYRRAVDINPRDYRAWYGLGQTYEIMNMLLYSLFYYKKAVELRPYDARMWCAIGGCYLGLERRLDAIRSFERAVSNNDTEGIATRKLAELYRGSGDHEQAARCYLRHLELRYQLQRLQPTVGAGGNLFEYVINYVNVDAPEAEALLFLATYYRDHGELELASMCCSRLLEYPGPEKEEGKALMREIRSRMDSKRVSQLSDKKIVTSQSARTSTFNSFDFSP